MPSKFAVASLEEYGILAYFYKNGTIEEVTSFGTPSNTSRYNSWQITANFSSAPLNITNVTPESDFAAIGWTNPAGTRFLRIFYQTTSGDIRSLRITQDQPWYLDPTVIANVPCGVPISAGRQVNSAGQLCIMVVYTDANGSLNQRFSTTVEGNWSNPYTLNV